MILVDKGYFDYDFEKVDKEIPWEETIMTDEEAADLAAMFGVGTAARKPSTTEELQEYIIKEEQKNGSTHTSSH